jgi:hypothetical protein
MALIYPYTYSVPFVAVCLSLFSALMLWWVLPIKWTFYVSGALIVAHLFLRDAANMQMQYHDPMAGIPPNAGFYQGPQLVGA